MCISCHRQAKSLIFPIEMQFFRLEHFCLIFRSNLQKTKQNSAHISRKCVFFAHASENSSRDSPGQNRAHSLEKCAISYAQKHVSLIFVVKVASSKKNKALLPQKCVFPGLGRPKTLIFPMENTHFAPSNCNGNPRRVNPHTAKNAT